MKDREELFVWSPTKKQFEAFLDREVAMCVAEVRARPDLKASQTLFSGRTWMLAMRELER